MLGKKNSCSFSLSEMASLANSECCAACKCGFLLVTHGQNKNSFLENRKHLTSASASSQNIVLSNEIFNSSYKKKVD